MQKKLIRCQVFKNESVKFFGAPGGAITIAMRNLEEVIKLSKLYPVLDYGGSVEVRPEPAHFNITQ